jgi:hypothetical protein
MFWKICLKAGKMRQPAYTPSFYSKNGIKTIDSGNRVMVNDSWAAPTRAACTVNDSSFHLHRRSSLANNQLDEFFPRPFYSLLHISGPPPPPCSLSHTIIFTDLKASTYSALSYTSEGRGGGGEEWQGKCNIFICYFVHQFLFFSTSIHAVRNALHFTHQKATWRQVFEENIYES